MNCGRVYICEQYCLQVWNFPRQNAKRESGTVLRSNTVWRIRLHSQSRDAQERLNQAMRNLMFSKARRKDYATHCVKNNDRYQVAGANSQVIRHGSDTTDLSRWVGI